ncbi:ABC transporter permease [Sinomonas sp. ASV486]|uniref:ABC transporter permease n=1 Tax=Sinomonas sp. ASV486 TaxID=3051170 RepID=UPI0027DABF46|nr:ABC transporter permease [Sinomonas sp. ASV486]MDQ4488976.1 ABC transporter permease [Sinomonas sp. ASV486]
MTQLILRRLLMSIPLLLVVSLVVFVLGSLVPGDPAQTILGVEATPDAIAALREKLGLDQPWYAQYGHWLSGLFHGDLGTSLYSGEPVVETLAARLPVTLSLVSLSTLLCMVIGIGFGMLSAVRGGFLARAVDTLSLAGLALPNFWVAVVLVTFFAVKLRIFPATGYTPFTVSPMWWIIGLVLPVCALSLAGIATVAKQTRSAVLDVLDRDYIRTFRASGVSEWSILVKHTMRNASIPVASVIGIHAIAGLDATVFVENVFVLPGMGSLATQATLDHDLPVIEGVALYFTVIVIVVNLCVDLAYGLLNPKVRTA